MENLFDNVDFNPEEESQEIEITADGDIDTSDITNEEESSEETTSAEDGDDSESKPGDVDITEFLNDTDQNDDNEINNEPSSNGSSSSPYNTFALALSEEGLISLNKDEKIESFKDLKEVIARTIKENELSGLTEIQRTYLESIRNGIPENEVISSLKNVESFSKITDSQLEEDETLRLELITQEFISKGYDKSKADKLAKRSVELGEDTDDAKEALINLKKTEEARLKNANKQREEQARLAEEQYAKNLSKIKETIQKTESIIPGIPLNSRIKDETFESMTKVVAYDESGNPLNALGAALQKNREDIELKLNYLFTVTKGLTDFTALKASTKSTVLKELENQLSNTQLGSGKTKSSITQSTSLKGVLNAIETSNF